MRIWSIGVVTALLLSLIEGPAPASASSFQPESLPSASLVIGEVIQPQTSTKPPLDRKSVV